MAETTAGYVNVSIIIPTFNRKESLLRTLDSLSHQTYPAEHFEVIVVDDGGSDGTEAIAQYPYPYRLRYVRQANQGAAAARNSGAAKAQGKILIFLDDDITVVPQFISNFHAELVHAAATIGVGTLQPPAWPDKRVFRDLYSQKIAANLQGDIYFTDCLSGILAVRREDFFQIGGMEDVAGDGRTAWGDVDFGYRAHRLGFRFRRALGAIGYHDDRASQDLATYCRVLEKASQQAVQLFQKYPDLQPYLPMFRDKNPIKWGQDSPRLILRKLMRRIISSGPLMWLMEKSVEPLEHCAPKSPLLWTLYRQISSGYIYRGYHRGLQMISAEAIAPEQKHTNASKLGPN